MIRVDHISLRRSARILSKYLMGCFTQEERKGTLSLAAEKCLSLRRMPTVP